MQPTDLLILCLAIWYTSYSVVKLSAPFNLFGRLRVWATGGAEPVPGSLGELLTCIYCFSVYAAVLWLIIWHTPAKPLIYPFALAGGTLMLHRFTGSFHT